MAMTLKEAEEDLLRRTKAEGVNEEKYRVANAETIASLRLLKPTLDEIPGIDDVMMGGEIYPEPQNGLMRRFWVTEGIIGKRREGTKTS